MTALVPYKPEYAQMLLHHCSQGLSYHSFSGVVGVSIATMDGWAKKHADFGDAKEIAFAKMLYFYESKGVEGMLNSKDFSATIWSHNMKARFRNYGWGEQVNTTVDFNLGGEAATDEELAISLRKIARED